MDTEISVNRLTFDFEEIAVEWRALSQLVDILNPEAMADSIRSVHDQRLQLRLPFVIAD